MEKKKKLPKKILLMKKIIKLTENDLSKIVNTVLSNKSLLKEEISNSAVDIMFNAHPGPIEPYEFFPQIIPQQYERTKDLPGYWMNACASKVSMALHKAGFNTPGAYKTDVVWNGVPAGSTFTPKATNMIPILKNFFGQPKEITLPTPIDEKTGYNEIPSEIKGKKGVYVIKTSGWGPEVSGHADVWNGSTSKGVHGAAEGNNYFGMTGTLYFWGAPTQLETNTKNCGWGNDTEGYKKSGWRCYDEEMQKKQSCPIINARKCGYKDDVKAYRLSGWKCKN